MAHILFVVCEFALADFSQHMMMCNLKRSVQAVMAIIPHTLTASSTQAIVQVVIPSLDRVVGTDVMASNVPPGTARDVICSGMH